LGDVPLLADAGKLARTGVSMSDVAEQLATLRTEIDQSCHLPALALSAVGEPGRLRYNGGCVDASTSVGKLRSDAEAIAEASSHSAIGYVSAEVANVQAVSVAASTGDAIDLQGAGRLMGLSGTAGLWQQYAVRQPAFDEANLATLNEVDEIGRALDGGLEETGEVWEAHGQYFLPDEEAGLADKDLLSILEESMNAEDRISLIGKLSQATDSMLKMTGGFAVAALAASAFWTANAVVMSDDVIDTVIGKWRGVAAAARSLFTESVPAIGAALFPDWNGTASNAAEKRFASFIADGMAFVARAERTATSLTSIINRLNEVYWTAFGFVSVQFAAIFAASMVAWLDPAAELVVQRLGMLLRSSVTVVVNAILAVVAGLLTWSAA
jgi:hypothetical protein